MNIQSLFNLMNQLSNGNANNQASGLMNFFSQNNKENNAPQAQQNNSSGLDISQILPMLSMLNGSQSGLANILPLLNNLNMPNGMNGLGNIDGMQNLAPFLNMKKNMPNTQSASSNTIQSKNFEKPFDQYKRL